MPKKEGKRMFLFEKDCVMNKTTIRGVNYITVSFYSGDKSIFQKVEDLINGACHSSIVPGVTSESLSDLDMDKKGA